MLSQAEKVSLLTKALAHSVPNFNEWEHTQLRADKTTWKTSYYFEVSSPIRPQLQRLVVHLRHDGDIEVMYFVTNKRGSPFEKLFVLPVGQEISAVEQVVGFVADLISEKVALTCSEKIIGGGRQFVASNSLNEATRQRLAWTTSWRGTFDCQID